MVNAEINGIQCILYYDKRMSPEEAPSGYPHMYHIRHDEDDWTQPITLERFVAVNFFGTVFMKEQVNFNESCYIDIDSFYLDTQLVKIRLKGSVIKSIFCLPN